MASKNPKGHIYVNSTQLKALKKLFEKGSKWSQTIADHDDAFYISEGLLMVDFCPWSNENSSYKRINLDPFIIYPRPDELRRKGQVTITFTNQQRRRILKGDLMDGL